MATLARDPLLTRGRAFVLSMASVAIVLCGFVVSAALERPISL